MSVSTIGYGEVKSALKEALIELFQERRDLFHDMLKEVVEEIGFAEKSSTETIHVEEIDSQNGTLKSESIPLSGLDDEFEKGVDVEILAYHKLHSTLLEQHPGEFVAIYEQQLVDHDNDKLALYKRIRETYPEQFVLMRQVEDEPERDIHFRSTRFFIPS